MSLTGASVGELCQAANELADRFPASIEAYALWSALFDIKQMFGEDDQGIPANEANRIDSVLSQSMNALICGGYLSRVEIPPTNLVASVISDLSALRKG